MKVAGTAEAMVLIYKITSHYVPKDSNLHSCYQQNLKSHMNKITLRKMLTPSLQWSKLLVLVPNSYHFSHTFELTFIFSQGNKRDLTEYQVIMRYYTNSTNSLKFWHSCTCILLLLLSYHITELQNLSHKWVQWMTLLVYFVLDELVILPDWYAAPEHKHPWQLWWDLWQIADSFIIFLMEKLITECLLHKMLLNKRSSCLRSWIFESPVKTHPLNNIKLITI
jgi:hypothetical protein